MCKVMGLLAAKQDNRAFYRFAIKSCYCQAYNSQKTAIENASIDKLPKIGIANSTKNR
jgi:hypothetical protein